jgi:hypothetical protein
LTADSVWVGFDQGRRSIGVLAPSQLGFRGEALIADRRLVFRDPAVADLRALRCAAGTHEHVPAAAMDPAQRT